MSTKNLSWKIALGTVALGGVVLLSSSAPKSEGKTASAVARGKYLVEAIGCADCHTPLSMGTNGPERDSARHLSGHPESLSMPAAPSLPPGPWGIAASQSITAWSGPWGVSFTANLTPDEETGLGKWTAEQFIETIRTRRHLGRGRPLLPPMPAEFYGNMTDEDLRAVFAYLQSIPAVSNRVPEPLPPPE